MRRLFFLALFWRAARTVDVYYYWVGSVSDPATACVFEHPGVDGSPIAADIFHMELWDMETASQGFVNMTGLKNFAKPAGCEADDATGACARLYFLARMTARRARCAFPDAPSASQPAGSAKFSSPVMFTKRCEAVAMSQSSMWKMSAAMGLPSTPGCSKTHTVAGSGPEPAQYTSTVRAARQTKANAKNKRLILARPLEQATTKGQNLRVRSN